MAEIMKTISLVPRVDSTHLEALTWIVSSYRKSFTMLKCKDGQSTAFIIGNPGSSYSKVTRNSLIDRILEAVAHNTDHSKPIKDLIISHLILESLAMIQKDTTAQMTVDNIDVDVTKDLLRENFNHCFKEGGNSEVALEDLELRDIGYLSHRRCDMA
ncbi:hypothetical protein Tco_0649894 [Tanacetum coccineum]